MAVTTQHEHYLAQLPKDWSRTTIAALGDIAGGGTPARGVKAFWGGDVPWITPGEVSDQGAKFVGSTRERITAPSDSIWTDSIIRRVILEVY